jgi:cytochrome c553
MKKLVMNKLVIASFTSAVWASLSLFGPLAAAGGGAGPTAETASADPAAGKAKAAVCGACHGPDGNSSNGEWPKIAGQGEKYLYEQLMAFKNGTRHNAVMQGQVATLTEPAMRDLAAYFAEQEVQIGAADPEAVTLGERLYRGGNTESGVPACMGCHGPSGAGNPAAAYPALSGQHAQYTLSQLKAYADGQRNNLMMNDIAARLSNKEMTDVASYIEGLY